jgi:hypothetical protein
VERITRSEARPLPGLPAGAASADDRCNCWTLVVDIRPDLTVRAAAVIAKGLDTSRRGPC